MRTSAIWIFLCAVLACTACNKKSPVEWEYQQVDWDNNFSSVQLSISTATATKEERGSYFSSSELIDAMGKHHWELVSVAAGVGGESFYFKRPLATPHEIYFFEPHYKKDK